MGLQWKHGVFTRFATRLLVRWQAHGKVSYAQAAKRVSQESSWDPAGVDRGNQPTSSVSTKDYGGGDETIPTERSQRASQALC